MARRNTTMTDRSGTMVPLLPKRGQIRARVIGEILDHIADLLVRESALVRGSEDQFVAIEKDMRDLHATLEHAEVMKGSDPILKTLVDEMRQLYIHAEDVVDAFINKRRRQGTWGWLKKSIFFFDDMISKHRFRKEIMKIRFNIHQVIQKGHEYGIRCNYARTLSQRVKDVAASDASPSYFHELQILGDEQGWEFFKTKVHVPAKLEVLGKEIVRRCMGSPTVISAVGASLSERDATEEQWSMVLTQLKQDQESMYVALPSYLRQCLFYFGFFQKGYDIPARRLIILWVAEGLVRQDRDSKEPPESTAERYLKELIEQNMIQVVKRKPDGKVKTCSMHDFQRDFWVSKAKEANFLHVSSKESNSNSSSGAFMIRRLADHLDTEDVSFIHIHDRYGSTDCSVFPSYYKKLCTFLSFDSREGDVPGENVGNFLHRGINRRCFQGLRVLDLERVFRPKLPESIGKLIHLRYLGLRWTYLEMLPSSIDSLLNLQTLDLKHTYISILPLSLWKMKQLRHLYLSESYRCRFVSPPLASSLIDLQTLWGAFVDEESSVNGLYQLINLRKLGLVFQLKLGEQMILARRISRMKSLESLRLISIDKSVRPSLLQLESLLELENLSSLYLLGWLGNEIVVDRLPPKLTELTLSVSQMNDDPMPKLGKLPNLRILRLLAHSYNGDSMCCSSGDFPVLQVLKLWKLQLLQKWTVKKGALKELRELEIRSCTRLEMIPDGLQHLVMKVKVVDMPEEFNARLEKNQGKASYKIEFVPSVKIPDDQSETANFTCA